MFNSILDAYNEVKTAFKTTFDTKIVKQFMDRGFESLDIKTNIIEKVQYDYDNLVNFMDLLVKVANIPKGKEDEFIMTVVDFPSKSTAWTGHEFFFKVGESDNKLNFLQVFNIL